MFVISVSYGNDSIAMLQWAHENKLNKFGPVYVVYCDTGWANSLWEKRIIDGEKLALKYNFMPVQIGSKMKFQELTEFKKGFPNQRYQWCSAFLKGVPFLKWIEENDPKGNAWVLIGKWSGESRTRKYIPSFISVSQYHGNRFIWHPLTYLGLQERNRLINASGFDILSHRSLECSPCVNANAIDFLQLNEQDIIKTEALEKIIGKNMFRPKRHNGAEGIRQVIEWAKNSKGIEKKINKFCPHGLCGH